KKYAIVPVGFITGQLESEREIGKRGALTPVVLPSGFVTMLMTDVEGSTGLVHQLGDGYRELIDDVWTILTETAVGRGGPLGATPDGVRFRRLGSYRLRGLPAPVPLFQVNARGLTARFPELRAASNTESVP